ncbi:hypothetical protein EV421DRAFT_409490 [Armillaria borealis]|uniref:Uncharacterized protein n=1 Tax=Armillaria borealis TaxID=47425 RepID=A0AA39K6U6_9AGAR|nr:hypothetical protein EV421DRAFT_409490 [Armillaria borealis]
MVIISSSITIARTKTILRPLVPMMQTPKLPLVLVRYSYMQGRPKGGSQFTLFLVSKNMPRAPAKQVREKLQFHMQCGEHECLPVFCHSIPNPSTRLNQKNISRTGTVYHKLRLKILK